MSARAIPGDPEYAREVTVEDVTELGTRLDEALTALTGVDENAVALAGVITALNLENEAALWRESRELTELAATLLERSTTIFENVMRLTGVSVDTAAEPADEPAPDDEPVLDDRGTEDTGEADSGALSQVNLPAQLQNVPPESARQLLGTRVFALSEEELDQAYSLGNGATVVSLCDEGTGLVVAPLLGGKVKIKQNLPEIVIRGINMYNRLLVAGIREFKKSDVDDMFGPPGGFTNMVSVVSKTNKAVAALGLPEVFSSNGLPKAQARYTPTGSVAFIG